MAVETIGIACAIAEDSKTVSHIKCTSSISTASETHVIEAGKVHFYLHVDIRCHYATAIAWSGCYVSKWTLHKLCIAGEYLACMERFSEMFCGRTDDKWFLYPTGFLEWMQNFAWIGVPERVSQMNWLYRLRIVHLLWFLSLIGKICKTTLFLWNAFLALKSLIELKRGSFHQKLFPMNNRLLIRLSETIIVFAIKSMGDFEGYIKHLSIYDHQIEVFSVWIYQFGGVLDNCAHFSNSKIWDWVDWWRAFIPIPLWILMVRVVIYWYFFVFIGSRSFPVKIAQQYFQLKDPENSDIWHLWIVLLGKED